jgi:hypothetical protein
LNQKKKTTVSVAQQWRRQTTLQAFSERPSKTAKNQIIKCHIVAPVFCRLSFIPPLASQLPKNTVPQSIVSNNRCLTIRQMTEHVNTSIWFRLSLAPFRKVRMFGCNFVENSPARYEFKSVQFFVSVDANYRVSGMRLENFKEPSRLSLIVTGPL